MDTHLVALRDFRDDLYACLYRRTDALFALAEAVLTAGAMPSPVHLSCHCPITSVHTTAGARG